MSVIPFKDKKKKVKEKQIWGEAEVKFLKHKVNSS